MNAILANALSRLKAALEEVERLDDFIKLYNELESQTVTAAATNTLTRVRSLKVTAAVERPIGKLNETEAMAVLLINESGSPQPTRILYEEMRKRGLEIGGKDGVATLSARLSRSTMLINDKPFGWRLREEHRQTNGAADLSRKAEEPAAPAREAHNLHREGDAGGGI